MPLIDNQYTPKIRREVEKMNCVYSVTELAQFIGCSTSTLRKIKNGRGVVTIGDKIAENVSDTYRLFIENSNSLPEIDELAQKLKLDVFRSVSIVTEHLSLRKTASRLGVSSQTISNVLSHKSIKTMVSEKILTNFKTIEIADLPSNRIDRKHPDFKPLIVPANKINVLHDLRYFYQAQGRRIDVISFIAQIRQDPKFKDVTAWANKQIYADTTWLQIGLFLKEETHLKLESE